MGISAAAPVPADIQPAEADLLATAIFLRMGIYAEAVPQFSRDALIRAVMLAAYDVALPQRPV